MSTLWLIFAFFHLKGHDDFVRCFYCGGGLRNWERGDNPWVEHTRFFPRCPYVRQCRGDQYVSRVLQRQVEVVSTPSLDNAYIVVPRI
jgi:hypothetical protein